MDFSLSYLIKDKKGQNCVHVLTVVIECAQKFVYLMKHFQAGADVNESDQDGDTPLTLAIENNYETVVRLLLENGANLIKQI